MIRPAVQADLAALAHVEASCFAADAWSTALVESELGTDAGSVLLAHDDATVTGYGSIRIVDDVADLQRIAVLPGTRRAGVGRELLETLLARAADLGASRILLEVAPANVAAIGLYQSCGFVEIARRKAYYADGTEAIVMEKALA